MKGDSAMLLEVCKDLIIVSGTIGLAAFFGGFALIMVRALIDDARESR